MMPENPTNAESDTQASEPSRDWGLSSTPATAVACAAAVIIFAGVSSLGPHPSWSQLSKWGYLPAERIWDGATWALISTAFVHFQLWHLAFNLYWLWRLGRPVERWAGSIKWVAFILSAAVVSSTAQLIMSDDTGIGASGIVYALFGLLWRGQGIIPEADALVDRNTVAVFLVWLVAAAIATHIGTANIGNAAHAAGLLFGILVAEWRIRRVRPRLAALATISLVILTLVGMRVSPWSRRWWELVGVRLHRAHEYDMAAWAYRRGLALGSDSSWAVYNLALTYNRLDDTARLNAAMSTLRRIAPPSADSLDVYFKALHAGSAAP
jgi:rhomboid protease GluP